MKRVIAWAVVWTCLVSMSCTGKRSGSVGGRLERRGDEIVACGEFFHTGAPVVLWLDPGGYDAYRTERRFVSGERASYAATTREAATKPSMSINSPNRYNTRDSVLSEGERREVKERGWSMDLLRRKVDLFVYHYDVAGTSQRCFQVLHDQRGLSVHFMLDIDGTIYQTLDLKERAWHGGTVNSRSIGIEIANVGAYSMRESDALLRQWYRKDGEGRVRLSVPSHLGNGGVRTKGFAGRPARNEMVVGEVQGKKLRQYDLTPQQYESLIKLTATLCGVFPEIRCDYPRDAEGNLITRALSEEEMARFKGLIGHFHVTTNKIDPGPAFQWDYVVERAQNLLD